MELDENAESLREFQETLEAIFQTADPQIPLSQAALDNFKSRIDGFAKDLALFKTQCANCKKKQFLGKIDKYTAVLNNAQEVWEILAA